MKKAIKKLVSHIWSAYRSCRYCGYSGGGWPDSGECPSCGEVN